MILTLAKGYDTEIGAGGRGLSVGQAQRVAFGARLLPKSDFLALDEPNAHLDTDGERALVRRPRRRSQPRGDGSPRGLIAPVWWRSSTSSWSCAMGGSKPTPPEHPIRRLPTAHMIDTVSTSYHTHLTLRRHGFDVTGFTFPRDVLFQYLEMTAPKPLTLPAWMCDCTTPSVASRRRVHPDQLELLSRPLWLLRVSYLYSSFPNEEALSADALPTAGSTISTHDSNGIRHYVPSLTRENLSEALYPHHLFGGGRSRRELSVELRRVHADGGARRRPAVNGW